MQDTDLFVSGVIQMTGHGRSAAQIDYPAITSCRFNEIIVKRVEIHYERKRFAEATNTALVRSSRRFLEPEISCLLVRLA